MEVKQLVKVFILSLSFFVMVAQAEDVPLPGDKSKLHLFILAGQSNMAGRGKLDDLERTAHPRVLSLNKDSQWQPAAGALHWDKETAGAGLGKTFGEIIADKDPSITVGLIPTACGGSGISQWQPGIFFNQTKSFPWDDCLQRSRRALQDGTLKAVLWHQGEADCTAKDAPLYEKRLEDLIGRFRTEFSNPDLPFIIGQLGRFPAKPWDANKEAVDKAQQNVARTLKHVYYVPMDGGTSTDNLHYDTGSLRVLAKGYAEAYLKD